MPYTIAVDAMGGDHGCRVTIPAVLHFLKRHPDACVLLVGKPAVLEAGLQDHARRFKHRLHIESASEVVAMDEPPAFALKNKKQSSMRIAINCVKEGRAQACVSAGNTGALMAMSRFVLKTLPGIDRPAIAKLLPNSTTGASVVLDLGANVECEPHHLLQFGIMGAMLASATLGRPNPTVGLLNVGVEATKGTLLVKQAAELLAQSDLNFYGFVEGNDLYKGTTDVVVTDGFTGNVALKASEGLSKMLAGYLREESQRSIWMRMCSVWAYPIFARFKKRVDPRRHNGASLLGLRGTVVKSHGAADVFAFNAALEQALAEVKSNVIAHITQQTAAESATERHGHGLGKANPAQDLA